MLQKSPAELKREREMRELRREQVISAVYNGIGTGLGLFVAGGLLTVIAKMWSLI